VGLRIPFRLILLVSIVALVALTWQLWMSLILIAVVLLAALLIFSMFVPGLGWLVRLLLLGIPVAVLSWIFRGVARLLRGGAAGGRRGRGPSLSLFGGRSLKGLSVESVEGGLLVVGDYRAAVREVVDALYRAGRRVIVVGGVGLVPDSVRVEDLRVVLLQRTYLNALRLPEERSERRDAVEKVAAALTVSEGLDAAEVGMLVSFIERVSRSGGLTEDDVERLRTEYGPGVAARLRDAVEVLVTSFSAPAPSLDKLLEGGWKILVLETYGLPKTHKLFVTLYSAYNLRRLLREGGSVVVLTDVELILPNINALPYDARHTWLTIHGDLMSLASSGLVMATSSPHVAPELLETVRGILLVSAPSRVVREVRSLAGVEIDESQPVLVRRERTGYAAYRVGLRNVPPVSKEKARTSALGYYQKVRAEASEAFRGTVLFADFGDHAEEAYRILRAVRYVRGGAEEVSRETSTPPRLIRELLEKGYIVEREGLLSLAQLGEEALADFEAKARGRRAVAARAPPSQSTLEPEQAGEEQARPPVQIGIGAYVSRPEVLPADLGEVYRLLSDSKAALARGDFLKSTRLAYKALHELLRRVSGADKGRLPDLAKQASARGVIVTEQEAKRAVGTIARVGRLQKKIDQGLALERDEEEAARADAEFLVSVVERALAALEGSPSPEEVEGGEGDEEPSDSGTV